MQITQPMRPGDGEEGVQIFAVEFHPAVPHVVRDSGMFAGEDLQLVVLVDHLAVGGDDERAVEETLGEFRVLGLGLGDDVGAVLFRLAPQQFGLIAGDVNGHLLDILAVVPVEDLVGEPLEGSFGDSHQADRQVNRAEPNRGVHQLGDVADVVNDLGPLAAATHGGLKGQCHILFDHVGLLRRVLSSALFG